MSSAESGGTESGSGPPQSGQPLVAETELAAGALKLPGVMVQAVTHIAPGLNVLLGLTFIVGFAGVTAPISYIIGGLICLGVAVVLTQLAKHITSAGGYFTYVSKTVGARAGWLTTWTYFLYDPVAVAAVCAFTSALLRDTLKAQYGWNINWYILFFVMLIIVTAFTMFGVALSAQAMLVLGGLEVIIFLALGISGLVSPGPGGFDVSSFNPGNIPSARGLYLGVVFTILALSGFESVAPMAEETENPRRNVPIAIVGSTIIVGVFYVLVNWGILVGFGTKGVVAGNFTASDQIFDLARRLWGSAWLLVLFATVNSALAVAIAIQNATTRVLFSMGRAGALPTWLGQVHPRFKTPWNAIWLMTALTLALGLGVGSWFGPIGQFGFIGTFQTLGLVLVYSMGNLGVFLYFWRERRGEFNPLLHLIIPLVTSLALLWVAYKTIEGAHLLHPQGFIDYPFWVALGWILIGVVILIFASRTGKEAWLTKAGQAAHERVETPQELSHHHVL
jgi:amino acid transporter